MRDSRVEVDCEWERNEVARRIAFNGWSSGSFVECNEVEVDF